MNKTLTARQRKKLGYWVGSDIDNFCPDTNDEHFLVMMDKMDEEERNPQRQKSVREFMRFSACVAALKYITEHKVQIPASVLAQVSYKNKPQNNIDAPKKHRNSKRGKGYG